MRGKGDSIKYIGGRNFIESIIYTLSFLEFQKRLETGRDMTPILVAELERQLCGLARAIPQLKKIYHSYVRKTLREMYPDYPLPEFGQQCKIRNILIQWFENNKKNLFKKKIRYTHPEEIKINIVRTADQILHEAIMGTFYKSGVLSHA